MGFSNPAALAATQEASESTMAAGIREGFYRGWLVEQGSGGIVAGGGIVITRRPPHPHDPRPERAEILNLYTRPEFRRRGLARRLMTVMIEWCRAGVFPWITLHASDDGRTLYEALGFRGTNEMRLVLASEKTGIPARPDGAADDVSGHAIITPCGH